MRTEIRKISKRGTTGQKTNVEEKRRKLESKVEDFHHRASQFRDENEDDNFEMLAQVTGWEREDAEMSDDESSCDDDDEDLDYEPFEDEEDEEVAEPVENTSIGLPSSYSMEDIHRLGLADLAQRELEL